MCVCVCFVCALTLLQEGVWYVPWLILCVWVLIFVCVNGVCVVLFDVHIYITCWCVVSKVHVWVLCKCCVCMCVCVFVTVCLCVFVWWVCLCVMCVLSLAYMVCLWFL